MELVAQRAAGGGGQEGSSAMDKLRESKGKAKLLVSEVRPCRGAPLLLPSADVNQRCGASQVAGAIRDDKQALRVNELDLLFSVRTLCAACVCA